MQPALHLIAQLVNSLLSAPDYEVKTSYAITLTVSDGDNEATQAITVAINNLDDNDQSLLIRTFNVDENTTAVGTVVATDADGDEIQFVWK